MLNYDYNENSTLKVSRVASSDIIKRITLRGFPGYNDLRREGKFAYIQTEKKSLPSFIDGSPSLTSDKASIDLTTVLIDWGDTGAFLVKRCTTKRKKNTKVHAASKSSAGLENIAENADMVVEQEIAKAESDYAGLRPEKFKIILSFLQIFSQMKFNYGIKWPTAVAYYMRTFASLNFDLVSIAAVDCIYRTNYYFSLQFAIILPIVAAIFLQIVKLLGRNIYWNKLGRIPRKCVKTGLPVKGQMNSKIYNEKRYEATKAALIEAGVLEPSKKDLTNELKESRPNLPPVSSISKKYENQDNATSELRGNELLEVVKFNCSRFKKRCLFLHYFSACYGLLETTVYVGTCK